METLETEVKQYSANIIIFLLYRIISIYSTRANTSKDLFESIYRLRRTERESE